MHISFIEQNTNRLTHEHAIAGVSWLSEICGKEKWNLLDAEVSDLLGGISVKKYRDIKRKALKGLPINLNRDTMERISLLLGIHKILSILAPQNREDLVYGWFNQPNTSHVFMGKSIKQYLMDRNTIGALYDVKRYLDSGLYFS